MCIQNRGIYVQKRMVGTKGVHRAAAYGQPMRYTPDVKRHRFGYTADR